MRKIEFRGKKTSGDWVYGVPIQCHDGGDWQICTNAYKYTVNPQTIGQYTGLTDKNGKKIFEGDILCGYWHTTVAIYYDECCCQFRAKKGELNRPIDYFCGYPVQFEVIGNIYNNPELLNNVK